jgi:hypothetical protein
MSMWSSVRAEVVGISDILLVADILSVTDILPVADILLVADIHPITATAHGPTPNGLLGTGVRFIS